MSGGAMRSLAACLGALGLATAWAAASAGEQLVLTPRGIEGSDLVVDVVASGLDGVGSFDLTVGFDASELGPPRLVRGPLTARGMVADNLVREGSYRIAVISPLGVSGDGDLVTLRFPVRGGAGSADLGLEARISDLNGVAIPSRALGASVRLGEVGDAEVSDSPEADEASRVEEAAPDLIESARRDTGPEGEDAVRDLDMERRETLSTEVPDARWEQEEERRRIDRAARLAGYAMRVRFDPEERIVEKSGPTPVAARLTVSRHGESVAIEPADVSLEGSDVEVHRVRAADDGRGLELELRVDREALPAWLEASAFGLHEVHLVRVYPRIDVDLDGSGDLTRRDYAILASHFGARKGQPRFEERFDILPNGRIDRDDLAAFRFNLVETERAQRLKDLVSKNPSEDTAP